MNHSEKMLERKIKWCTALFIVGLFVSGATAIPLLPEVNWLANLFCGDEKSSVMTAWLLRVRDALVQTQSRYPFLFYGTDWLAFGHFMIALVFIGALRDPVRHQIGMPRSPPNTSANGITSTHAIKPKSNSQRLRTGSRSAPMKTSAIMKWPNASQSVP